MNVQQQIRRAHLRVKTMPKIYIYVVDRDLGFAPNPFHGVCSLATCKPDIRSVAKEDDWVFGVGGKRLKAVGKLVFAMKVTRKLNFDEYWKDSKFRIKRSVRNGTKKIMVGDNIYSKDETTGDWIQAHSHHSYPDGTTNFLNLKKDTRRPYVLLSNHFYYFGSSAPIIPFTSFKDFIYQNHRKHRTYRQSQAQELISWLENNYGSLINKVLADPFDFDKSSAYYSPDTDSISL